MRTYESYEQVEAVLLEAKFALSSFADKWRGTARYIETDIYCPDDDITLEILIAQMSNIIERFENR